jgi:molybdopterin-guanine dinucleotide biosynthesis protein A
MEAIKDVTGVILAGGKSLRYGRNKALVRIEGIPLIERVVNVMSSLFRRLILITNTPDEYAFLKLPMHKDLIKGLGPIGGIFTALMTIKNSAGFFVACDMPNLNPALIHYMVEIRDGFDAVVPRLQEGTEALHALYGKRCLPPIKQLIDSSQYQIFRFYPSVSVRYVNEAEIRRFDPQLESFFNINKPDAIKNINKVNYHP